MGNVKEIAIDSIRHLPDSAKWEDVRERIEFMAGIRKSLLELDKGQGIPHEDIENESSSWLSK